MTDPTKGIVDSFEEGHVADLQAVPEDVSQEEMEQAVTDPEELLQKIEKFVDIDFDSNAKHYARVFQETYAIDLEDLIEGTRYENSCLSDL